MSDIAFTPYYGATVNAASSAGVANVTTLARARALLLTNVGTQLVFIRVKPNGSATDASATDMPLPAGSQTVILKSSEPGALAGETVVSIFGTGAGSTIYVTPGEAPGL